MVKELAFIIIRVSTGSVGMKEKAKKVEDVDQREV